MKKNRIVKILVGGAVGTLVISSSAFLIKRYSLQKEYNRYSKIEIKKAPIIFEDVVLDREYVSNLPLGEEILNFVDVMSYQKSDKDLKGLYKNLNTIEIEQYKSKKRNLVSGEAIDADYILSDNVILMYGVNGCTNHELFHVSSSKIGEDGTIYCGFSQFQNNEGIGGGLDEGYTQLITERYFDVDKEGLKFYVFEKLVASLLEKIVGQNKMETLYLNSDLYGLVSELSKYVSEDEIMFFLQRLDYFSNCFMSDFVFGRCYKLVKTCLNDMACFLFKVFYSKLVFEGEEENIILINNFVGRLLKEIKFNGRRINFFTEEDKKRIIEDVNKEYKSYTKIKSY